MVRENKSLFALLGVLSLGPQSGYEIKKLIEQSLAHFWQEGYGQIYPNLKRLVNEGFATVEIQRQDGRPDRKVYTITSKGEERLQQWLIYPIQQLPKEKHEILLKLFFGKNIGLENNLSHVKLHKQRMKQTLDVYRGIETYLKESGCDNLDSQYQLMTVRYGILTAEAVLQWCEETTDSMEKLNSRDEK